MIDFHNHIIPNLDDGSRSLEISLSMLRHAAEQGITDVVNTVHYQSPRMDGKRVEYNLVKDKIDLGLGQCASPPPGGGEGANLVGWYVGARGPFR